MKTGKLKIEIWSDVQCPFCYIGKHKFEQALDTFKHRNELEIIWKSFQLNPNLVTDTSTNNIQYLAKHKGISIEEAKKKVGHVAEAGAKIGLKFNFETAIVANTFKAHQILHLAKKKGVQNQLKELLFEAQFVEGKNIDDTTVLADIAQKTKLGKTDVFSALENKQFTQEVQHDFEEAKAFGIQGVPFFVFDRKYAISGAQDHLAFSETLEKSFDEWKKENPTDSLHLNTR